MSLSLAKVQARSEPFEEPERKDEAAVVTRPLPVTSSTAPGGQGSAVHDLHADIEKAFKVSPLCKDESRKIPFAVTLISVSAFSAACWGLVVVAIHAIF